MNSDASIPPSKRMIVVAWQCDPETRLIEELQECLDGMNLSSRNLPTGGIVIPGHALHYIGTTANAEDASLPRIGVEWDHDEKIDDLGHNYKIFKADRRFQERIAMFKGRGRDDQVSYEMFNEMLSRGGFVERYLSHVKSMVVISGFCLGESAQKTALFLYQCVEGVLPIIELELQQKYKVDVSIEGQPNVNIYSEQFGRAFGFEIMVAITQLRRTYRHLPERVKLRHADIHMVGSKSRLFGGI